MPPAQEGPRVNGAIRAPQVRCIDPEGGQLGVLDTRDAINKAEDFGLDLVEVQPNVDPPYVKSSIMVNSNMKRRSAPMRRAKSRKSLK